MDVSPGGVASITGKSFPREDVQVAGDKRILVETDYFSAVGQPSFSSSREAGRVQCRFIPLRSRATARFRARLYVLRSRTICSRRTASIALIEVPSSAARIFASRSRKESTLRVLFVFKQHLFTCSTVIRGKIPHRQSGPAVRNESTFSLATFPQPDEYPCDI